MKWVSKRPPGKSCGLVQLARVGNPLVNEDQAWPIFVEQHAQGVAGAGGVFVVVLDHRVTFLAAKLPREFTPQGADHRAVRLSAWDAGRNLVADDDDALGGGNFVDARLLKHRFKSRQFGRLHPAEQVIERQHGVRLAAAEIGLQLQ